MLHGVNMYYIPTVIKLMALTKMGRMDILGENRGSYGLDKVSKNIHREHNRIFLINIAGEINYTITEYCKWIKDLKS